MKTAAIIAEYNPFHNGHKYQIEETRRLTGADFILIIMSGNFVQRGAPALCNKYLRTRMALLNGADAVIELPSLFAVSSAEFFAGGTITLLNRLGIIDYLSFGSESGDMTKLNACAQMLLTEPETYRTALSHLLKKGLSFPAARYQAFLNTRPFSENQSYGETPLLSEEDVLELFSSPNNILGLEYCKALLATKSRIMPITVKRQGGGYHEQNLQNGSLPFSSASSIRNTLADTGRQIRQHVPCNVYQLFEENNLFQEFLTCNDFSLPLYYKLLSEREKGFSAYLDCTEDISDKICRYLPDYKDYAGFCALLKSKDLTYTRISRILLHILLDLKTPESFRKPLSDRELSVPYARLLGFKREASPLLSSIKKSSLIPLISNLPKAHLLLQEDALQMLKKDIYTCDIYEAVSFSKNHRGPLNEYKQSPVIL